jgi:hypothetical protein
MLDSVGTEACHNFANDREAERSFTCLGELKRIYRETPQGPIILPPSTRFLDTCRLMRWSAAFNLCWAEDVSSSSEEDHRHADSIGRH